MTVRRNAAARVLVLGSDRGWHADQLREGAKRCGCDVRFVTYESLHSSVGLTGRNQFWQDCDAVLTRTMPAGSIETITYRLSLLHACEQAGCRVVNSARSLEVAIDKYFTLVRVERLGIAVPPTVVTQNSTDALRAFEELGGDVVVKPLFGGEGRGVMRVGHRELAWTTFRTLERLQAVCYVQRFIPPGGRDVRLLVLGNHIHAIRRVSREGFRTNVSAGGTCEAIPVTDHMRSIAEEIVNDFGLRVAGIDLLQDDQDRSLVLEVNGIPGWRGAQRVIDEHLGQQAIATAIGVDHKN